MRVLNFEPTVEGVSRVIDESVRADYVYMYPPRQAYRRIGPEEIRDKVAGSLGSSGPINLYAHVPFCSQICSFCNLFAVAGDKSASYDEYVSMVLGEVDEHKTSLSQRVVETIYIGGGTPSLLSEAQLTRLVEGIANAGHVNLGDVREVALEVAPATVSIGSVQGFRRAGINRINLGVQSWGEAEFHGIGRRHSTELNASALEIALGAGFSNVCVDLIYGLPGQTDTTWEASLAKVVEYQPHTVCCYALTLRPGTGYAARGDQETDNATQYHRYEIANSMLVSAGYVQETHVRWSLPGGGYLQKRNHWAGQDILGVGAGARSYLREIDVRNGYSVQHRLGAYRAYMDLRKSGQLPQTDGFVMTADERARKSAILGLAQIDLADNGARFGAFGEELLSYLAVLAQLRLGDLQEERFSLTALGQKHRDVLVQPLFSAHVRDLCRDFDYRE